MNSPIVSEQLMKRYGRTDVLQSVDLAVPQGSVYALIGSNGAGKTTLLKTLVNILQPSAGHCHVLGTESRHLKPRDYARIAYVSENQQLPGWMTVGYWMEYLKPFYPKWNEQLASELLRDLHLPLDRKLRHLSRGMQMKAALAGSLAYEPEVIILDEPFSGLDPLVRDEFIQGLLGRLANTTVLISSHDLAELESFATHVGFLCDGRIQFTEELQSLTQRFRRVLVKVDGYSATKLPAEWLQPEASSSALRFVHSAFQRDTPQEVRSVLAGARDVIAEPMPLREIFVTLARESRTAQGATK